MIGGIRNIDKASLSEWRSHNVGESAVTSFTGEPSFYKEELVALHMKRQAELQLERQTELYTKRQRVTG